MKSIGQMIDQLDGMLGTKDLTQWEDQFLTHITEQTNCGINTGSLSEKQVAIIERIYRKHFGDAETV